MRALALPVSQYASGWCGTEQHGRCTGMYAGADCSCTCHTLPPLTLAPEPDTTPEPIEDHTAELAAADDHDLGWALSMLGQAIAALDASLKDWNGNTTEHAELLGHLRDERKRLAGVESIIETKTAGLMRAEGLDLLEWEGGTAERRGGAKRTKWEHEALSSVVAQRIAEDLAVTPEGELDEDLSRVAFAAVERYAETNRPDWRMTALKQLGIDPGEYCHTEPGRPSVQVDLAKAAS